MCAASMIYDHYRDKWNDLYRRSQEPTAPIPDPVPAITPEEIAEFRKLLERARKYDRENNEPDCELEEKREKLRKLAEELGVDIAFA